MTDETKAQKRWADLPQNLCKALSNVIAVDRGQKHNGTLYLPKDAALQVQLLLAGHYTRGSATHYGSDTALRNTIPSHDVWVYDNARDETVEYLGLELNPTQMEPFLKAIAIGKASSRYGIREGYIANAERSEKSDADHIAQCLETRQRAAERAAQAVQENDTQVSRLKQQEWGSHSGKRGR